MMVNPLIVFFDTFTHDGHIKEHSDCVTFKSGIQLFELRIIPFGSVVECNISDEPIIGATNPASFDLKVYSNNRANGVVLQPFASFSFDEKHGIGSIVLKEPLQSNFLLFRGRYSTLTVAIFGVPLLPIDPSIPPPAPNLSVPPPPISLPMTAPAVESQCAPSSQAFHAHPPFPQSAMVQPVSESKIWTTEVQPTSSESLVPADTTMGRTASSSSLPAEESTEAAETHSPSQPPGFYEDGEIQDVDYEEISSNEELFSDVDDADYADDGRQLIDAFSENDPRLERCIWRFNPWTMAASGETGSAADRLRIPDPAATLFQMHCWLLERTERVESTQPQIGREDLQKSPSQPSEKDDSNAKTSDLMPPPPDDWTIGDASAKYLCEITEKFTVNVNEPLKGDWVESIEGLEPHLATGLAFLYHTNRDTFQTVVQSLIAWVYVGLDMTSALRQTDSAYIVRHLMAGINLAGLVTGTLCQQIAWSLLYPDVPSLPLHMVQLEVFQVQHLLLNLMESPLITSTLKLAICRALDQTSRLSVGLDAFLGRSGGPFNPALSAESSPKKGSIGMPSPPSPDRSGGPFNPAVSTESSPKKGSFGMPSPPSPDRSGGPFNPAVSTESSPKKGSIGIPSSPSPTKPENDVRCSPLKHESDFHADGQDTETKLSLDQTAAPGLTRTPYQRLIFLFAECKNARVTAACQRLLNKIHAYEVFLEFHEVVEQIRAQETAPEDVLSIVESEHRLNYLLVQIDDILHNAGSLLANPRQTSPGVLVLERTKESYHNPFPDLCSMMDSTKLLDDISWLVDRFKSPYESHSNEDESSEASYDCAATPDSGYDHDPTKPAFITQRSDNVWHAQRCLLTTFMSEWNMLTFLASRPESTSKLLSTLLNSSVKTEHGLSVRPDDASSNMSVERLVLGLELAYKLETIRRLDVLIDWARKKGVTGTHSTVAGLISSSEDWEQSEPALHSALYGLARLCVSYTNAPRVAEVDEPTFEAVKAILSPAGPTWMAQVICMEDNFAPFLMLLQAFAFVEKSNADSADLALTETTGKGSTDPNSADGPPNAGTRASLRQLLSNPLSAANLLNAIVLSVLHHSEDVHYLERYGPHLAQLVHGYIWEESMNESTAVTACNRLQSFARAGAPYLSWLRDFPSKPSAENLLSLYQSGGSLFSVSLTWLVNQLKPLQTELEEAMNELISIETADELFHAAMSTTTTCPIGNRRQNQGIVAGRGLPPALLLLLRLLRVQVCDMSGERVMPQSDGRVHLGRSMALIELYSAEGLHKLSTLIEKLADFFLLNFQATISQAGSSLDLLGVSAANSNISLILAIMDCAVHLVSQMLSTILKVQGSDFQDCTPVRPLCRAYACAVYAICPPGPKRTISKRIQKLVVSGLLAYMSSDHSAALSVREIEKSLWVTVCREIISFTTSAPMYYIPGLKLLLELLPLPLPIVTLRPLDQSAKNHICSARDRWTVHLLALMPEFAGLTELLGGTDPVASNPLYVLLSRLVQRLADLGVPCAVFLATSCLDTMFTVFDDLLNQTQDKTSNKEIISDSESTTKSVDRYHIPTSSSMPLRTAGVRLLLQPFPDPSFDGESPSVAAPEAMQMDNLQLAGFADLEDTAELTSTLALLYLSLQLPTCRYAILHLLRQNSVDETIGKSDRQNAKHSRKQQFLSLIRHILLVYSDKPGHVRTQLMLLKCLDLLFHTELADRGFDRSEHSTNSAERLLKFAEGQADLSFAAELVPILLEHIGHPDRDMTTLPSALYPLLFLTAHDQGFIIIRNTLDSPAARTTHGQHFFANMVQRVNDCFSAENPDCQITLAVCLRLLQSLLIGRSELPITFTPDGTEANSLRQLHISSSKVRDWIGWSAGGDEGKPVRDLHALLEMLTDDEPSLEYLRSGMKNLLSLLSEELDIPECDVADEVASKLPPPRTIEQIFASRPTFVSLDDQNAASGYKYVLSARRKLGRSDSGQPMDLADEVTYSADVTPSLVPFNFTDLASNYCGGVNIKEELAKCGRQRSSGEASIRHQRRRRGQSSIIETGRSSKKFVAPMRGRGFVLRSAVGGGKSTGSADGTGSTGSLLSGSGASGARPDPFRSRPLNTSRPPSLHVDDFTKLVKDDAIIEEVPRQRVYRDSRSFRGRGSRPSQPTRDVPSGLSLAGALVPNLALGLPVVNSGALLPNWHGQRTLPLMFNVDSRNSTSTRRDRTSRQ